MFTKGIGNAITLHRRKKGIAQKDLAESCGITAAYLSQVEKGKKTPSFSLITKICEVLNINEKDLYRAMFFDSVITHPERKETILMLKDLLESILELETEPTLN